MAARPNRPQLVAVDANVLFDLADRVLDFHYLVGGRRQTSGQQAASAFCTLRPSGRLLHGAIRFSLG
jgi:hypothetical protein